MNELGNIEAKDWWDSFKDGVLELVKNFLEGENKGESEKVHGGGMRMCKKQ